MESVALVAPAFEVVRIGYRHGVPAAVLTQLPAGALIATFWPRFENPTLVPACRRPATARTPGQLPGDATAWPASLPAEMTITVPAARISLTASTYPAWHTPGAPRLKFSTRAAFGLG